MIIITAITTLFSVINKFYCSLRCFYDVVIFYRLCFLKRRLSRDFFHVFFLMIRTHLPIYPSSIIVSISWIYLHMCKNFAVSMTPLIRMFSVTFQSFLLQLKEVVSRNFRHSFFMVQTHLCQRFMQQTDSWFRKLFVSFSLLFSPSISWLPILP